tara:strand:+ start:1076 stop:1417 length:342 start_codon:yes stop_codon:yes gene_type:complete
MMIPNLLFKVISNDPINESMVVKFCRENAPEPIDQYKAVNISYYNLDFSSTDALVESIRSAGSDRVLKQLNAEPILVENKSDDIPDSVDLNEFVGRIVSATLDPLGDLNQIEL